MPMGDNRRLSSWTKWSHTQIGLWGALFFVVLCVTGVLLNHPGQGIPGIENRVLSLVADASDPQLVYRGKWSTLERSYDGGQTWEEVPMAYPPLEPVAMAFHPQDASQIYVLQRWLGLIFSSDGGMIWESLPMDFDPQEANIELQSLAVSAAGDIYVGTSAGLLKKEGPQGAWHSIDFDLKHRNWYHIIKGLHTGHFFGEWFVKVYDVTVLALLLLILSGYLLWRWKKK